MYTILDTAQPYFPEVGTCSLNYMTKRLSALEGIETYHLWNTLVGSYTLSEESMCISISLDTNEIVLSDNFPREYNDTEPCTINVDTEILQMHISSVDHTIERLRGDTGRYIYIPVGYDSEEKASGHRSVIAFDTFENKVYLVDPNGFSCYFNGITPRANHKIEMVVDAYVRCLSQLSGVPWEYSWQIEWCKSHFHLNVKNLLGFDSKGHCVGLTFVICHLLNITQFNVGILFQQLFRLEADKMETLVGGYYNLMSYIIGEPSEEVKQLLTKL